MYNKVMIQISGVTKRYGKKSAVFTALDDVSFIIPEGKSVAILGKSGSGKSTLMHAISGLDRPQMGEVTIDEVDILRLKKKPLDTFRAKTIGFIFQSFFVQANESCYDNVSLPLEISNVPRRQRRERVRAALEAVELGDKLNARARNLSGGQKQRLAVARAIVGRPRVLFADEPTGNLDSVTGEKIENLLFRYARDNDATLIIVTHDEELSRKCDMVVRIRDGRVASIDEKTPAAPGSAHPHRAEPHRERSVR